MKGELASALDALEMLPLNERVQVMRFGLGG